LFQVAGRTVRRWIEGTRPTPKVAIERLRTWAYALDQTAQAIIMRSGVPAVLPLYRQDRDVPPWTGLRTAGCHLALVRRVFERRPDIHFTFDRATYRYWLGARVRQREDANYLGGLLALGHRQTSGPARGARPPSSSAMPARSSKKPEGYRAKDFEHETGTRDAAKNHPRMDVASEGQATDRRAGQAFR
jgi:hypothetical protein